MAVRALGYHRHGAYADRVEVYAGSAVAVPDSVDYVKAAAATDSGVVAHHAIVGVGKLHAGEKVGIIGVGGLGQIAARIAVNLGAEVYAAEINEDAQVLARSLGVADVRDDIRAFADDDLDHHLRADPRGPRPAAPGRGPRSAGGRPR